VSQYRNPFRHISENVKQTNKYRNIVSGKEGIMKKRILTLVAVVMAGTVIMTGCTSNKDDKADGSAMQNEVVSDNANDAQNTISEVRGTVDEIKDFMVVVTDANRVSYGFTFDEKPEGLAEVKVGDTVIVKYTGTINEVDPFMGEVLSVEKQ